MSSALDTRVVAPILLIEDEASVRAFVRAALERKGYSVVQAASGAEGVELLATASYGGVISDIRMPGTINGADIHGACQPHHPDQRRYSQQRNTVLTSRKRNALY